MNSKRQKDPLFHQLIVDLAQDIIDDTQAAANQTISLSAQFLDIESQKLVETFHDLCANGEPTRVSQQKSGNADAIIEGSEKHNGSPQKVATYAEQLSAVQQGVQQVVKKDAAVRAEINIVFSAMQFSELLRQHLKGLCDSFQILIRADTQSPDEVKTDMLGQMHTYDERKAFYTHVMHQDMPAEDAAVSQDLIDRLIG